jgi:hypothetical protein
MWTSWPLVDEMRWSWTVLVGVIAVGIAVWQASGGWLLAIAASIGLAATLWRFFLPTDYEAAAVGLRRRVLGRTRLVPWHAVRAYRLRASGIVLYQRSNPSGADLLRSMFIPYPADADELLCAMRQYASHASELPK